ncbi:HAMP domain-containing histidine kinase [Halobacillus salinarum]|uniref:histidine kinase n=1 Tax=Halobacillus salinarum TaxID=2932257 RepID=A0ABY4EKV3_9BACI|nr:HAMP domain-containing sensor histidine kinase [Halobacillus salinarum]UOQ44794.1 HAMP domain-containing histidine kinase [Halobacillus salinarum]
MKRGREWWMRIGGIVLVTAAVVGCWSLAYYMTSRLDVQLHPYPLQIINSLLGFFIFGVFMYAFSKIGRVKRRQQDFFRPMIEAMKEISRGNYNIDLTSYEHLDHHQGHPMTEFVENIRNIADNLGEMEQMRQEFISNVSHEIQSPLTSISGFAYELQHNDLTDATRNRYLHIIENESLRLSKLSENLLKLTSLESDHPPFEPAVYRLDQQLRRVILSAEPQWSQKELELEVSLDPVSVEADEELMDQVWLNLLHNAIKFTPEKGTISIQLMTTEAHTVIQFIDSGIGISKEDQLHIFERFYKADRSRTKTAGGSGLGLSIVKRIMDMHSGEIEVKSEQETGTEFLIKLPKNHHSSS